MKQTIAAKLLVVLLFLPTAFFWASICRAAPPTTGFGVYSTVNAQTVDYSSTVIDSGSSGDTSYRANQLQSFWETNVQSTVQMSGFGDGNAKGWATAWSEPRYLHLHASGTAGAVTTSSDFSIRGQSQAIAKFYDNFTITSKTLAAGASVDFSMSVGVDKTIIRSPDINPSGTPYEGNTVYLLPYLTVWSSGVQQQNDYGSVTFVGGPLWYPDNYNRNGQFRQSAILHARVGQHLTLEMYAEADATATAGYVAPSASTDADLSDTITLNMDPLTAGASYSADSGISYLTKPKMLINRAGNQLQISWPSPSLDWTLEQSPDLSGGSWAAGGYTVSDDGTNKSVTVALPPGSLFFRLNHP